MKFINLVYLLLLSSASYGRKCCEFCPYGEVKYYYIDNHHDICRESCINPRNFLIYKKFESGLQRSFNSNPCADLGYYNYETTEIQSDSIITMAVDKYSKA